MATRLLALLSKTGSTGDRRGLAVVVLGAAGRGSLRRSDNPPILQLGIMDMRLIHCPRQPVADCRLHEAQMRPASLGVCNFMPADAFVTRIGRSVINRLMLCTGQQKSLSRFEKEQRHAGGTFSRRRRHHFSLPPRGQRPVTASKTARSIVFPCPCMPDNMSSKG